MRMVITSLGQSWPARSRCWPAASWMAFHCGAKRSIKSSTSQNNSSTLMARPLRWLDRSGWFCSYLSSSGDSLLIQSSRSLITPVQPALRAVAGGMVALEGSAECFVALAAPDGRDGFLKDVAQDALFFVFAGAAMAEGGKTTGEDVAARCDVGQRVGALAARPGPRAKIAYQALHRGRRACGGECDTMFPACLGAAFYQFEFFGRRAPEQRLFRLRQPLLEEDKPL